MPESSDTIRYSLAAVREAVRLHVEGANDPDSDRSADLARALTRLPTPQYLAVLMTEMGYPATDIAQHALGKRTSKLGTRLVADGFATLRKEMNGYANPVGPARRAAQR